MTDTSSICKKSVFCCKVCKSALNTREEAAKHDKRCGQFIDWIRGLEDRYFQDTDDGFLKVVKY